MGDRAQVMDMVNSVVVALDYLDTFDTEVHIRVPKEVWSELEGPTSEKHDGKAVLTLERGDGAAVYVHVQE